MSEDYLQPQAPELLPEHLRDPESRARHEAQARQEINQKLNSIQREMQQNPDLYRIKEGSDTVWIKNNRARSVAIGDIVVPGELNDDGDGPFRLVRQSDIDSNMKMTVMFEGEKPMLTQLSPEEYRAEYRKYLERMGERKSRINNRELTDAEKERRDDFKVRPEVLRNAPVDQS